jgi:hypothetical protein
MVSQTEMLGKVTDSSVWAEDVTARYVDIQARLGVFETKRERLMALLQKSGDLTAVIQLENELAATNAELESLKGQMRYLLNQTDYSTLEVSMTEKPVEAIGIRTTGFAGFSGRVWEAFLLGINGAIGSLGDMVVWFVRNLIGIAVTVIAVWLFWGLGLKRWLVKRRGRKADKQSAKAAH